MHWYTLLVLIRYRNEKSIHTNPVILSHTQLSLQVSAICQFWQPRTCAHCTSQVAYNGCKKYLHIYPTTIVLWKSTFSVWKAHKIALRISTMHFTSLHLIQCVWVFIVWPLSACSSWLCIYAILYTSGTWVCYPFDSMLSDIIQLNLCVRNLFADARNNY